MVHICKAYDSYSLYVDAKRLLICPIRANIVEVMPQTLETLTSNVFEV